MRTDESGSYGDYAEQSMGYAPMTVLDPAPKEDAQPELSRDEALAQIDQREREGRPLDEVRQYIDAITGEPKADNQTISAEQAAHDVANARQGEIDAKEAALDQQLAEALDRAQTPAQPEPQPLPEDTSAVGGDQVAAALQQNPALLSQLQEYVSRQTAEVESIRAGYAAELAANAFQATASIFSSYPELQGVDPQNLAGALQLLDGKDPARALQIRQHIAAVSQMTQAAQHAQQQAQQAAQTQHRQQFDSVAAQADNAFESWFSQQEPDAGRRREISSFAKQMLLDEGLSREEIEHHYNNSPLLRSVVGQRLIADAARYRMAQQIAKGKAVRPVPIVQRPGSPMARSSDEDHNLRGLSNRLGQTGSAKDAAALLIARRSARR